MQHGNTKTPNTHHDWRRNSFVRTQIATKTHFLQTKPPFLTGNCYLRKQLVSHQQLCIPYRMLSRQVARLSVGDSYFCTRTEEEGDSSHLSACIWCYHNDYKRWLAAVLAFLTTDLYPIVDYSQAISQVPPKQCRLDALDLQHLLSLVLLCILAVYMLSSIVYLFVLSSIVYRCLPRARISFDFPYHYYIPKSFVLNMTINCYFSIMYFCHNNYVITNLFRTSAFYCLFPVIRPIHLY